MRPRTNKSKTQSSSLRSIQRRGIYQIHAVHLELKERDELEARGIYAGALVEAVYSDHYGKLVFKTNKDLLILGRNFTSKISACLIEKQEETEAPELIEFPCYAARR